MMAPRKDTEKAIEFRITFGDKERTLAEEAIQTYRLGALLGDEGMALGKALSDPLKLIALVEAIATLVELFGIETPIPTPVDAYNWLEGVKAKAKDKAASLPSDAKGGLMETVLDVFGLEVGPDGLVRKERDSDYHGPQRRGGKSVYSWGGRPE